MEYQKWHQYFQAQSFVNHLFPVESPFSKLVNIKKASEKHKKALTMAGMKLLKAALTMENKLCGGKFRMEALKLTFIRMLCSIFIFSVNEALFSRAFKAILTFSYFNGRASIFVEIFHTKLYNGSEKLQRRTFQRIENPVNE